MYLSVVMVIARIIRANVIVGSTRNILYEYYPCVDYLVALINRIYLARSSLEFKTEEELFAQLVFLYRSPETMIKVTRIKPKQD